MTKVQVKLSETWGYNEGDSWLGLHSHRRHNQPIHWVIQRLPTSNKDQDISVRPRTTSSTSFMHGKARGREHREADIGTHHWPRGGQRLGHRLCIHWEQIPYRQRLQLPSHTNSFFFLLLPKAVQQGFKNKLCRRGKRSEGTRNTDCGHGATA